MRPAWGLGLLLFLGAVGSWGEAASRIELVRDAGFETGFRVIAPRPLGRKVFEGEIRPSTAEGNAEWELAQWASRFSLFNATREESSAGGLRLWDGAKTLAFGGGEIQLGVNSTVEYEGRPRKREEDWPHLLVEQSFHHRCPPLSEVSAIPFRVECRLDEAERFEPEGYTPDLHAAQFLLYFIVQNVDPESAGHGDFLWLGVPVYDDRGPVEGHVLPGDVALNKVIFMPSRKAYTEKATALGEWIAFEADLLPLTGEALEAAWKIGKLTDSKDLADYRIVGMNMGWEVPGTHRVRMSVRGLSLGVESRE